MNLESMAGLITDSALRSRLVRTVDDLNDTIRQIRRSIFALQESQAEPTSIRTLVMNVVDQVSPLLGFRPRIRLNGPLGATADEEIVADLKAVLRESLTNVAKHARASAVEVDLTVGEQLTLVITDDGVGLNDPDRRSGLRNLQERAEHRGGSLDPLASSMTVVAHRRPRHWSPLALPSYRTHRPLRQRVMLWLM